MALKFECTFKYLSMFTEFDVSSIFSPSTLNKILLVSGLERVNSSYIKVKPFLHATVN